jgi:hypothetical protein
MKIEKYNSLDDALTLEIEDFLISANSLFNPLFSSPLWALRLKKMFKFNFIFYIVRNDENIQALLLVFSGYRGYQKIDKLPKIFKKLAIVLSKLFFGYHAWFNSIVFLKEESNENKKEIKKLIYLKLSKYRRVFNSPIELNDYKFFPEKKSFLWGTMIIDISNNSYNEIFSKFKRNAKRPIKESLSKGFHIRELSSINLVEYVQWLIENQSETGKSNRIDSDLFNYDLKIFDKKNYIYKVFIAYSENRILGSISVWGFGGFVTEKGVYRSKLSKKNGYFEQDLLKDWIVRFCIDNDIHSYDLAGYNPNKNLSKKEEGIKKFKEKFGGKTLEYENIYS